MTIKRIQRLDEVFFNKIIKKLLKKDNLTIINNI